MLVHGGLTDGLLAWFAQDQLAERWTLRVIDRAGYGMSSHLSASEDIELDARLIAAGLHDPVHLVGHSSGAIVAMLAAAQVPRQIRSLTVIEPPSYRFLEDPEVISLASAGDALWDKSGLSDDEWLLEFFDVYGGEPPSQEVLEILEPHVQTFRRFVCRPWEIELPVHEIRAAGFPCFVISGGHDSAVERLNDRIAEAIGARRAVVEGAGHEAQTTGPPFNQVLGEFLSAVERSRLHRN